MQSECNNTVAQTAAQAIDYNPSSPEEWIPPFSCGNENDGLISDTVLAVLYQSLPLFVILGVLLFAFGLFLRMRSNGDLLKKKKSGILMKVGAILVVMIIIIFLAPLWLGLLESYL